MKLQNKTKYNGTDLRALIIWVSNMEGWTPCMRKLLNVVVVPSRKWHSGEAWTGDYRIEIRIPGPYRLNKPVLASLIAHELKHLTNKKHVPYSTERQMRGRGRYGYRDSDKYWSGANALNLRVVPSKSKTEKTPMDKARDGLKHALDKSSEYERKIRLAENRLKKWKSKVKYYERRMKKLEGQPEKPRKAPKISEKTLLRRAINKHITNELSSEVRQSWEVYSMMTDTPAQASGLRGSWEEEWEGDFVSLKDARKIIQPGETMLLRGYRNEEYYGEYEIDIPSREEILGKLKMAAQKGEGS